MYEDEYHGNGSLLAYDGELIPAADAVARYERDEKIEEKYIQAVRDRDLEQLGWDDVEDRLEE